MIKFYIAFIICLYTGLAHTQIYPLNDTNKNEVYGYISFGLIEKMDKKQNNYMATLLDINLNIVGQAKFTDDNYIKIGNIHFNNKTIYFEVIPTNIKNTSIPSKDFSYRIYDLGANTISEKYLLPEVHKEIFVRGSYPIENEGYGLIIRNFKSQVNKFYAVTNSNQMLYQTYPYGNPEKKRETEHIKVAGIGENLMVTINKKYPHGKSDEYVTTLLFIDVLTGNTIKEIALDNKKTNMDLSNVQISNDRVYAFADTYEKKETVGSGKTSGLFKAILDRDGNVLMEQEKTWADFQSKINIDEGGFVKKVGFIYTHDYILDPNTKHTIVIGEYIKGSLSSISVKDMIFLDFDENFNLVQVFEVEKKESVLRFNGFKMGGSRQFGYILEDYNYFDYRFANFLEDESGLSFFYFNTEKLSMLGQSSFSHGIVTFKDGKFNANKLKWEASMWKDEYLKLLPSKPGYFLLSKISKDKMMENRLEKIDY